MDSVFVCGMGAFFVASALRDRAEWGLALGFLLVAAVSFFFAWLYAGELWDRRKRRLRPNNGDELEGAEQFHNPSNALLAVEAVSFFLGGLGNIVLAVWLHAAATWPLVVMSFVCSGIAASGWWDRRRQRLH